MKINKIINIKDGARERRYVYLKENLLPKKMLERTKHQNKVRQLNNQVMKIINELEDLEKILGKKITHKDFIESLKKNYGTNRVTKLKIPKSIGGH